MRRKVMLGVAGLVVAVALSAAGTAAQESSAPHPADIRLGNCASLGEAVMPLSSLAVPDGDPQGQTGATPVAQSVTEVPLLLTDILGAEHAVAVHASEEQIGTPVACGEIGGTLAADGTLSIGLQAMNGARLDGVASFAPTAAGDGTLVTLLLVDARGGHERGGADAVDGADATDDVADVVVVPAPDRTNEADATDPGEAASAGDGKSGQPGKDGAVDHPGRDRDGNPGGDNANGGNDADERESVDRSRRDRNGNGKGARAGEDGTGSS